MRPGHGWWILALLAGCGSRTGLPGGELPEAPADAIDASVDACAGVDTDAADPADTAVDTPVRDARPDLSLDSPEDQRDSTVADGRLDVTDSVVGRAETLADTDAGCVCCFCDPDASDADVEARPPPIGPVVVDRTGCPETGAGDQVYVVGDDKRFYAFDPPTAKFTLRGVLGCPVPSGVGPYSMAIDRSGTAYVLFNDWNLYRVDTTSLACVKTAFVSGQHGFAANFGLAFAGDAGATIDPLYVAGGGPVTLARVNPVTYELTIVRMIVPTISTPDLTGTADGRLFAFYGSTSGTAVGEVRPATGDLLAESQLPSLGRGGTFTFALFSGDFWLFTSPSGVTMVTRFRPADGSITSFGTAPSLIVGAAVSPCAH